MDKGKGHIAVAIVVDSSHTVLTQWKEILHLYVSPLLGRLVSGNGGQNILLGLVTYANAEHRPTPVLAKRYFAHPKLLIVEMQEDPQRLCLGRTNSNATTRLAALEGYAAAIDMFEIFLSSQDIDRSAPMEKPVTQEPSHDTHHIIHITACSADNAQHPVWNQTAELDSLSWKTLPDELAKRNVNLNLVMLRRLPQFTELHSSTTSSPTPTWFETRPGHQVLLSTLPSLPLKTSAEHSSSVTKRTISDAAYSSNAGPDAKKPKTTQESPAAAKTPSVNNTVVSATSQPNVKDGATQPATGPVQPPSMALMMQLVQKNQALEAQLKVKFAQMQAAQQAGRTDEAEKIKVEMAPQFQNFRKIREYLNQFRNLAAQHAQNAPTANPSSKSEGQTLQSHTIQSDRRPPILNAEQPSQPQQQTNPASSEQPRRVQLPQAVQQKIMQQFFTQNPALYQRLQTLPPEEFAAQLHKMMQQRLLSQQGLQQSNTSNPSGPSMPQTQPAASQAHDAERWLGTLSWSGHDAVLQVRKEVTAQVAAVKHKGKSIRADLWPSVLRLIPAPERHVHPKILMEWIKRHDPPICKVVAYGADIDKVHNESSFKSLITLLQEKGMYAICSWKHPPERPNVVIFPTDNTSLAAAIFPETGAPDLPTGQQLHAQPQPQQLLPSPEIQQNPARPVNVYPNIPPNSQNNTLLQLARAHQMGMGINTAAFAGAPPGAPFRIGAPAGMNQHNPQMSQIPGMGMGNMMGGQTGQAGPGSNPVNMNIDMMQSFMKRNFGAG